MKVFLLALCAAGLVVAGFVLDTLWLAGLGLVVGFSAMWVDHGHVRVDEGDRYHETSMEVRKMRSRRRS